MMAPSRRACRPPCASRLRILVCSLNSTVVSWFSMPGRSSVWTSSFTGNVSDRGARPLDVDLALHLVHQVLHVGAVDANAPRALAARHVADDGLAANRIAALGAIDHQVVDALDLDDQILVVAGRCAAGRSGAGAAGSGVGSAGT